MIDYTRSAVSLWSDLTYINGYLGEEGDPMNEFALNYLRRKVADMVAKEKALRAEEEKNAE